MGASEEMLSETSGKNNAGKWEVGQEVFSKTGSYRFKQCVMVVGWGQRVSSCPAMPPQQSFLQPPETFPKGSAVTVSSPGPKAVQTSPLPEERKLKPLTGIFWVLHIVWPNQP